MRRKCSRYDITHKQSVYTLMWRWIQRHSECSQRVWEWTDLRPSRQSMR